MSKNDKHMFFKLKFASKYIKLSGKYQIKSQNYKYTYEKSSEMS